MRILSLLSVSSLALVAALSAANAQATNFDRQGGMAPTIGNTHDSMSRPTMGGPGYASMGSRMNRNNAMGYNAMGYNAMGYDAMGFYATDSQRWAYRQQRTQRQYGMSWNQW